jgi:hypothetical protein
MLKRGGVKEHVEASVCMEIFMRESERESV